MPINNPTPGVGEISNLITNMTIAGASDSELECVIRHSVVVLDCERSYRDNGIAELSKKYSNRYDKIVRRLLMANRFTFAEVAEIVGIPVRSVREIFENED